MRLVSVLLVVMIAGLLAPASAQNNTEAPYLYYYSADHNAYIIERADGTDSHLFAEDIVNSGSTIFQGAGWSPSGEWFAFTESDINQQPAKPHIVNVDSTTQFTMLDEFEDAVLAWWPDHDVLLVVGTKGEVVNETTILIYIMLVDVANQSVIAETKFERAVIEDVSPFDPSITFYGSLYPSIYWIDDSVVVYHEGAFDFENMVYLEPSVFTVLKLDGSLTKTELEISVNDLAEDWTYSHWVDGELYRTNLLTGEQFPDETHSLVMSPTGEYGLLQTDATLQLVEIATGDKTLIYEPGGSGQLIFEPGGSEQWSPDGRYVMFMMLKEQLGAIMIYDVVNATVTDAGIEVDYMADEWPTWSWVDNDVAIVNVAVTWKDSGDLQRLITYRVGIGIENTVEFEIPAYHGTQLAPSPDGRYFYQFEEQVYLYDRIAGPMITYGPDSRGFLALSFGEIDWHDEWVILHENANVAGGGYFRWISVARLDGTQRRELVRCGTGDTNCVGWLPDQVNVDVLPPVVQVHPTYAPVAILETGHWSGLVSFSPDGHYLAGGIGSVYSIWNVDDYTSHDPVLFDTEDPIVGLQWDQADIEPITAGSDDDAIKYTSPDGRFLVRDNFPTTLVDVVTGNDLMTFDPTHMAAWSDSCGFTSDSRIFAPCTYPLKLVDTETMDVVATLPVNANATVFSPDGMKLAVSSGYQVHVFDLTELYAAIGYAPPVASRPKR